MKVSEAASKRKSTEILYHQNPVSFGYYKKFETEDVIPSRYHFYFGEDANEWFFLFKLIRKKNVF